MPSQGPAEVADVIEHVMARFHEVHRLELPLIVDLARAYELRGGSPGLGDRFQTMADALESHMFKEEMRLFPMMLQGGSTLIRHVIADLQEEHDEHRAEVNAVVTLLRGERPPAGAEAQLAALRAAVRKLFEDLAEHMRIEDERLFPMFEVRAS